jgi:hypothetical protein
MIRRLTVNTLTRMKTSLIKPLDHITPIYMIAFSRAYRLIMSLVIALPVVTLIDTLSLYCNFSYLDMSMYLLAIILGMLNA